jgi:Mn-dependent DtxR family transcriptional regulator
MLLEIPNHLIIEASLIAEHNKQTIDEVLLQALKNSLQNQTNCEQSEIIKKEVQEKGNQASIEK